MWKRALRIFEFGQSVWGVVTSAFFKATIWPLVLAAVSAMIGVAEGFPWFYISIGSAIMFAAAATCLLRADELIDRRRVQSKLRIMEIFASIDDGRHLDDGTLTFHAVQFGIHLDNAANFPIDFKIQRFVSDFDRRKHEGPGPSTSGTVMIQRPSRLGGTRIDLDPPIIMAPGARKIGNVDFEIAYGRKGRLKHIIRHRVKVNLGNDARHRNVATVNWEYADQPNDNPSD